MVIAISNILEAILLSLFERLGSSYVSLAFKLAAHLIAIDTSSLFGPWFWESTSS